MNIHRIVSHVLLCSHTKFLLFVTCLTWLEKHIFLGWIGVFIDFYLVVTYKWTQSFIHFKSPGDENISDNEEGLAAEGDARNCGRIFCEVCGRAFCATFTLKRHMISHSNQKSYLCDICGKMFSQWSVLYTHCLSQHHVECKPTPKFPKICLICGRKFTRGDSLKRHFAVHSEKILHHCKHCQNSYAYRQNLLKHMRKHHVNECTDWIHFEI